MHLLDTIILLPLLAALVLCLVPRNFKLVFQLAALAATFAVMLLALVLFCRYDSAPLGPSGMFKFEHHVPWVASLGISYHVGIDGINVGLLLMGAVVAFAAACCAW